LADGKRRRRVFGDPVRFLLERVARLADLQLVPRGFFLLSAFGVVGFFAAGTPALQSQRYAADVEVGTNDRRADGVAFAFGNGTRAESLRDR
jgi:hypothetical protein